MRRLRGGTGGHIKEIIYWQGSLGGYLVAVPCQVNTRRQTMDRQTDGKVLRYRREVNEVKWCCRTLTRIMRRLMEENRKTQEGRKKGRAADGFYGSKDASWTLPAPPSPHTHMPGSPCHKLAIVYGRQLRHTPPISNNEGKNNRDKWSKYYPTCVSLGKHATAVFHFLYYFFDVANI